MLSNLKKARIAANLTIDEVSKQLNIRKSYLYALEENQLNKIPGEVYINGYLKLYSKLLNIEVPNIHIDAISSTNDQKKKKDNRFKNYLIVISLTLLLAVIIMYPIIMQYGD